MKIDLSQQPELDILRDKKRYVLWFCFFMGIACLAVVVGVYAVYFNSAHLKNLDNWALGLLVAASMGVTRYGNRLQEYKVLFPPQREKLTVLRAQFPVIETYCSGVEALGRRFIRAEYEACVEYGEIHEAQADKEHGQTDDDRAVYGPQPAPVQPGGNQSNQSNQSNHSNHSNQAKEPQD